MIKRHRKKVKLDLQRAGQSVKILRSSGGTENNYGKVTGESYSPVKDSDGVDITEYAAPDFGGADSMEEIVTEGGTFDNTTPQVFFQYDSVIQEGDRIIIYGIEVEIQNVVNYPTHKVAQTVNING